MDNEEYINSRNKYMNHLVDYWVKVADEKATEWRYVKKDEGTIPDVLMLTWIPIEVKREGLPSYYTVIDARECAMSHFINYDDTVMWLKDMKRTLGYQYPEYTDDSYWYEKVE